MGRGFRIKLWLRRFARRHSRIIYVVRSFTVFSAAFGGAYGFIAGSLLGAVQESLWTFLDHILAAMQANDFAVFPAKMLAIGFLVALTACLTGLTAQPTDNVASLLPRGFVRGVLAVMLTSLVFSLAA